jgi:hypothetical protein
MTALKLKALVCSRNEASRDIGCSFFTLELWRRQGILLPITDEQGKLLAYSRADIKRLKEKLDAAETIRRKPGPKRVRSLP